MTIRELLLAQCRRWMLVKFGCWLAFAGAGLAASSGYVPTWVVAIPFIGFGGAILTLLIPGPAVRAVAGASGRSRGI